MNIDDEEGLSCLKCGEYFVFCDCFGYWEAMEESGGDKEYAAGVERRNREAYETEAKNLQVR